ncbi:MAG: HAMP domain-containing sensor histidine kinase [Gemmataceae bacterium]
MRSIRLSLLVYFLLLVTASLGGASLLIYRSAQNTLREKEEATAKLIHSNYEKRWEKESARLNDSLLARAQSLARRVRMEFTPFHLHEYDVRQYTLTTWQALPNAHFLAPVYLARQFQQQAIIQRQSPRTYPVMATVITGVVKPRFHEPELVLPAEGHQGEYYQIDCNYPCKPLRSKSLGTLSLPVSDDFAPDQVVDIEFDDYQMYAGKAVRRVRLKTAPISQVNMWGRGPGPGGRLPPFRPRPTIAKMSILIQCAADLDRLDNNLAALRESRDEELQDMHDQTQAALVRQRNWLLGISGLTFASTVLGCFGLVWLGLQPLRKLSDAVSEISPRNFTLSLGKEPLPVELQPIAERLGVTLDQLRRAFAREKQATADISHELRTPLAALLTTIELALRRNRPAEQYREMLQECHGSATHMHQIVERLLTLARLDAGVDRLRARSVDVGDLAEQCATAVRPLAEAKGVRLSVVNGCPAADADAPTLRTDPDKLREVLNNLLHNAIQYNRPDGRIDLVVGRDDGHVRVEVRDTGIGIDPQARERIFERFFRADPSRACDGMNAGLGLAIVKEYVELMGGHISVESSPGQGSTFRVELPVQAPASAA